jgi:hypothetical protein
VWEWEWEWEWEWNILREEHRLWVYENRVLRKIFGAKWNDITGE